MKFSKKEQLKYIRQAFQSKKSQEKDCSKLWAEVVKLKAGNKCEWWFCNKTQNLNAHHLFTRSFKSTKFLIENSMCLCAGHHSLQTDSAHKDPRFWERLQGKIQGYRALRDERAMIMLEMAAKTPQKLDLKLIKIYLENELKKYSKQEK